MDGTVCVVFKDPHHLLPDSAGNFKPVLNERYKKTLDTLGGNPARAKARQLITEMVTTIPVALFMHPATELPDGTQGFLVTVDIKYTRDLPHKAREHRPFEVLHKKGNIVTMLYRPRGDLAAGLIFKVCFEKNDCEEFAFTRDVYSGNSYNGPASKQQKRTFDPLHASAEAAL